MTGSSSIGFSGYLNAGISGETPPFFWQFAAFFPIVDIDSIAAIPRQTGPISIMNKRMKVVSRRLLAVLAFAGLATPLHAQEMGDSVLDEIVVTATRRGVSVRDVARSISVVGKERIQQSTQQLGIDEALAVVPGLYIQNRYNFSGDLRVAMRGFGARSSFGIRGIKVYVDGIPETLPDGQSGVDSIDMGSAQSIEVLRGPSSSLYGNASGGCDRRFE